jgi:hypothetical protein
MRRTKTSALTPRLLEVGLAVGLILPMAGCIREDSSGQTPSPTEPAPAPAAAPVPSQPAVPQVVQDREQFRRALVRKFDASQMVTQQLSAGDGILYVPNGHVAHAMVAVKNVDGTVSRHCLSSAAEVEALMKHSGGDQ